MPKFTFGVNLKHRWLQTRGSAPITGPLFAARSGIERARQRWTDYLLATATLQGVDEKAQSERRGAKLCPLLRRSLNRKPTPDANPGGR